MKTILIIVSTLVVFIIIRFIIKKNTSDENTQNSDENTHNNNGSLNESVTLEYVKGQLVNMAIKQIQCPKCGKEAHNLNWFKFRSSNESWRHLAGREGYYSKCSDCNITVDDIITKMN